MTSFASTPTTRPLRPVAKALPEEARAHNRALVLQTLRHGKSLSRADIARETGLTRVTVSDLVASLLADGLVREAGHREDSRPGKPAILLEVDPDSRHVLALDLSDAAEARGAVIRLDGSIAHRVSRTRPDGVSRLEVDTIVEMLTTLEQLSTRPILGIGVGTPGIVDPCGTVLAAPNLGWRDLPLRALLSQRFDTAVVVLNDADVAVLAEHSFGGTSGDVLLVALSYGVGAGVLLGGMPMRGSHHAAGEIGHVTVGTDGGPECACGRTACLETWLAVPRLRAALATADGADEREEVLRAAGRYLGIALAPIVGVLDLDEIVISGPPDLLAAADGVSPGPLVDATVRALDARTLPTRHEHALVRLSTLGRDAVLRGAAAAVVSDQLGVS